MAFVARPQVWSPGAAADPALLRPTFRHEVRSPSLKVIMWDWELPHLPRAPRRAGADLDEPTPMLFCDGHAGRKAPSQAAPPAPNPFPDAADLAGARLHNTPEGVFGRDY